MHAYESQRRNQTQQKETQLSLTNRATHLCKCNGVADLLKQAPPHMCYHAEFARAALKVYRHKYKKNPKIGELWKFALLGWET